MSEKRKSQPVEIQIHSFQTVQGEVMNHQVKVVGQLVTINGIHYLRYEEVDEETGIKAKSTIKLDRDDRVIVTRKVDGSEMTTLRFDPTVMTATRYHTPYGSLPLLIQTDQLALTYHSTPFSGQVQIVYNLLNDQDHMGRFHVEIEFTV